MFWFWKNTIKNQKFYFLTEICKIRNKHWNEKSFAWLKPTIVFPFRDFNHVNYWKITGIQIIEREYHDKNVFFKADRALRESSTFNWYIFLIFWHFRKIYFLIFYTLLSICVNFQWNLIFFLWLINKIKS